MCRSRIRSPPRTSPISGSCAAAETRGQPRQNSRPGARPRTAGQIATRRYTQGKRPPQKMPSSKNTQPIPPCPHCHSKFTIKKGRCIVFSSIRRKSNSCFRTHATGILPVRKTISNKSESISRTACFKRPNIARPNSRQQSRFLSREKKIMQRGLRRSCFLRQAQTRNAMKHSSGSCS